MKNGALPDKLCNLGGFAPKRNANFAFILDRNLQHHCGKRLLYGFGLARNYGAEQRQSFGGGGAESGKRRRRHTPRNVLRDFPLRKNEISRPNS